VKNWENYSIASTCFKRRLLLNALESHWRVYLQFSRRSKPACRKLDFRKAAGLGADSWKEIDVMEYIRQERDE